VRLPRLRRYRRGDEDRLEPPADEHAGWILDSLRVFERWHRYRVVGLEHVPAEGAALIVGFHAFSAIDMLLLGRRIYVRDGRVIRGLTDRLAFHIPGVRDLATTMGIVVGSQANGVGLLRAGHLAACMPGGALEWSRSSWQRRQLRWGDHRGYARLAIRTGAPIIPTACPNADSTFFVPYDGWKLGLHLQRLLGAPRPLPLPMAIGLGPLGFPIQLTQHIAPPIHPDLPPEAADDPAAVAALDARVRAVITALLA
jgi:1-acyl-sn-glycerol-3-phosphate acyltransferase